jgi:outer membrane protein OmpA-like peptidoglycan-associated protein
MIRLICLIHFAILPFFTFSQTFWGLQNGRSPGIFGLHLQPAAAVGQHPNIDIKLTGLSTRIHNNFIGINTLNLYDRSFLKVNENTYQNIFPATYNGRSKALFGNFDLDLPGLSIKLSPKNSLSITGRFRNFLNVDGLQEPGARFAYEDLKTPDQFGIQYNNSGLGIGFLSYAEFALGFGQQVYDDGTHRINVGGRAKVLAGIASGNLYVRSLLYSIDSPTAFSLYDFEANAQYGFMGDSTLNNPDPVSLISNLGFDNMGLGADLGIVYEYRPQPGLYRLRLGLSILDLGSINFRQNTYQYNLSGQVTGFDIDQFQSGNLDSTLQAEFTYTTDSANFRVGLPSALSIQADLRVSRHFYVNVIPLINLRPGTNQSGVHHFTGLHIAPRLEGKFWGLALPFSMIAKRGPAVGINLRLGPVILGTSDFLSPLIGEQVRGLDFHMGFRTPITIKKKADTDKDGVPDKKDDCPQTPGLAYLNGCPELDTKKPLVAIQELDEDQGELVPDPAEKTIVEENVMEQPIDNKPIQENIKPVQEEFDIVKPLPEPIIEETDIDSEPVTDLLYEDNLEENVEDNEYVDEQAFENIYFQPASNFLDGQARYSLNRVYDYLRKHPETGLKILGHADEIGPEDYNEKLSRKRAETVKRYFVSRGVSERRLRVEYFGETKPLDSFGFDDSQNRRVELILLHP